jgi:hypothetical protein
MFRRTGRATWMAVSSHSVDPPDRIERVDMFDIKLLGSW